MQCVQASSSVLLVVAEDDLAEVGVVNILGVAGHAGPCALGSAVVLVVELLEQSAHGLLRQVCGTCNLLHAPVVALGVPPPSGENDVLRHPLVRDEQLVSQIAHAFVRVVHHRVAFVQRHPATVSVRDRVVREEAQVWRYTWRDAWAVPALRVAAQLHLHAEKATTVGSG
jgi:hypothetical protein